MSKTHSTQSQQEKAVLVGVAVYPDTKDDARSHLEELALLAETAGAVTKNTFIQKVQKRSPATFVGRGMLETIRKYVKEESINLVIFDDELSASQLRNIEKSLECKVLDRTNLILDIFARRARTAHARLQVELAQYKYLLPRLKGMWTHLERQQGGIGLRGPGETEIETDRRIIRDKMSRLKKQLVRIDKQKSTQRMNRGKMVRVALVGYTNAGKSTLLNSLSKSKAYVENKLFATLDTTVRKVVIRNLPFLLADTVGFIHKLPHCLVESFKATLDEVREADLLLHVVDASHPQYHEHMQVVTATLKEIGADNIPVIRVFNKIDLLPHSGASVPTVPGGIPAPADGDASALINEDDSPPVAVPFIPVKPSWKKEVSISISAKSKTNFQQLLDILYKQVKEIHITRYPYNDFLFPEPPSPESAESPESPVSPESAESPESAVSPESAEST